jgi:hypothetical protein
MQVQVSGDFIRLTSVNGEVYCYCAGTQTHNSNRRLPVCECDGGCAQCWDMGEAVLMDPKPKRGSVDAVLSIRLPRAMFHALSKLAEIENRYTSELARRAIAEYIRHHRGESAA